MKTAFVWMAAVALVASACGEAKKPGSEGTTQTASDPKSGTESPEGTPKSPSLKGMLMQGAGASFPYPLYSQWAHQYSEKTGARLNYQSIGSGGGIAQIKAKTVDFGASDAPMKAEELEEAGLVQFPTVMGGVVPVIRLKGIAAGQIRLSGHLLAEIYLGNVKKWNDPALARLNAGVVLPATDITVVHRADGSGTSWIFTEYLSKVSPAWSDKVGFGSAVSWPAGVGGKGNEGVAAYVQRVEGSIGYIEYAYAIQNKLSHVLMQNQAGQFVSPAIESFQSAAAGADWGNAPGFYMILTNQPGERSWPITGATFILMHKNQPDADKARAVLSFFDWAYAEGDATAEQLHYVPLPDSVVGLAQAMWTEKITSGGKTVYSR